MSRFSVSSRNASKITLKSEINITPFVDVMLVLLIIFMVTTPMLITGVEVDLPKTKTAPLSSENEPIVITVTKTDIYIQDMKIEKSSLETKLKALKVEKKDLRIFVRGDKDASYGRIMEVFGDLKESGFPNVALVTKMDD